MPVCDGETFTPSYAARVLAIFQCSMGVIAGVAALALRRGPSSGWAWVFLALCLGLVPYGLNNLFSKVTVDGSGVHIRRLTGWRDISWSSIGFIDVKSEWTRVGKIHRVRLETTKGRTMSPYALTMNFPEDAETLADSFNQRRTSDG